MGIILRARHSLGLASLLLAPLADAGSYMQSGGDLQYSTSLGHLWATEQWDAGGNLGDAGCRRQYSYSSHRIEYGQSYYRTLFGGVNLARSACASDEKFGLGDIHLGVRGRLDLSRNHRTWEVEATLPTPGADASTNGGLRVACGAFGLAGSLAIKEKMLEQVALGASAGVQLWEAPLAHQTVAELSAGGAFGRWSPWRWELGASGKRPLNADSAEVSDSLSDCGTRGEVVRGLARLSFTATDLLSFECGVSQAVWGRDTGRTQGAYCGFSRLWK